MGRMLSGSVSRTTERFFDVAPLFPERNISNECLELGSFIVATGKTFAVVRNKRGEKEYNYENTDVETGEWA